MRLLFRKSVWRLRVLGIRRTLTYAAGLDGRYGSRSRFLRLLFAARLGLLVVTPCFFLLPGPAYAATTERWMLLAGLVAWTFFFRSVLMTAPHVPRLSALVLVDQLIAFIIFSLAARDVSA
jgi:hypothetical protein